MAEEILEEEETHGVRRTTMPQYGECEYWDERYTREPSAFDWYQGYGGLKFILHQLFPLDAHLLQIGVGSSRLQEDMAKAGWAHIVNVDYSKVAIAHMAELHRGYPQLQYSVADARHMPEFSDASFDGVLDKGTLDATLCGERSGQHAAAMMAECHRVLRPGGTLMLVTYGDPTSRLPYLEQQDWTISVYAITKQEVIESLDAEPVVRPLLKGPYPATNVDCMDALSGLEGIHFVYVCRKPEAGEEEWRAGAAGRAGVGAEAGRGQREGSEGVEGGRREGGADTPDPEAPSGAAESS